MKFWAGLLLVCFPIIPLTSQNSCREFIESEKNIKKIYQKIKGSETRCAIKPATYLDFGKRAYLAGEYSLSLWSLKKGIQSSPDSDIVQNAEYFYYLGLTYLSRNRLEEAIATLKKIVFHDNYNRIDPKILQKSHMALLQCYYNREKTHDKNVKYLIELFKTRYESSSYLYTIRSWNTVKYSSN